MIEFSLKLTGLANRLVENSEEELYKDGLIKASKQAKIETEINFLEGGRPPWNLTRDGRVPLYVTGKLKDACGKNARVVLLDNGIELHPQGSDREVVAEVQDARYNIYDMPDEALNIIGDELEKGILEE